MDVCLISFLMSLFLLGMKDTDFCVKFVFFYFTESAYQL
jgi:hypothetical protein